MNNDQTAINKIFQIIEKEKQRQQHHIELIASENIVSQDVLNAVGSILTNKYAEGYTGKRYYAGCEYIDEIEEIAKENFKKLFNVNFVNVQPHSGSQANQAVLLAFLKPGDKILGMNVNEGGHLTHGLKKNMSGMWFDIIPYGVNKETNLIDYEQVEKLAQEHRPKLIIAGFSAYSRKLDWEKFSKIAKSINAILMADIAHVAGLIACNLYPSPVGYADIITSTTHKTLRGPRGGIIMTNSEEYYKKINSAIFPGLQGGPLMHVIAGKAVASQECLSHSFIEYSNQVILNSQALSGELISSGLNILTGGTDNHLCIIDLRNLEAEINGDLVEKELEKVNIICNKNLIPGDPLPSTKTSGIRLGTPACTTRGFKQAEFIKIGKNIAMIIEDLKNFKEVRAKTREFVINSNQNLTEKFKIYQ